MGVLMEVKNLVTRFYTQEGTVYAVNDVSYKLNEGETLGVVGESGSGKSVHALSIMRLIPSPPGKIEQGEVLFGGRGDLLKLSNDEMRLIRGAEIAMIFQDPMTSLNPVLTIGTQITEALKLHKGMNDREAEERAAELLTMVGIPDAKRRLKNYPHQFSGGMRQRVMIAMALSCNPKLLIADEPTTALDVTTQAQILDLMLDLQREYNMSILFITHDLGVVAEIADSVAVMYLGRVVESSDVDTIFNNPKHPYTQALLSSVPKISVTRQPLAPIQGMVPSPFRRPSGCTFHPRCSHAMPICQAVEPSMIPLDHDHRVRCLLYDDAAHQIAPPAAALAAQ